MVRGVQLQSLAKINLDLRVLHKRADGFHELRTVFQTISVADRIGVEYEPARKTELILDDPLGIADNLILRAARAVLDRMKVHARVHFTLRKSIPMGGGLGGGSSNAAAVLLALPVLAGRRLDEGVLTELGAALGSDVPFFLFGGTALGIGRGTELYPLPDLKAEPMILVCPGVHSSTAQAYAGLRRGSTVAEASSDTSGFRRYVALLSELRSARGAASLSENDFEPVVCRQHSELKGTPAKLRRLGAAHAQMSGSGSAFFGIFDGFEKRDRALKAWRGCPALAAEIVGRRRYQALWRRQLREHATPSADWPPQSRACPW